MRGSVRFAAIATSLLSTFVAFALWPAYVAPGYAQGAPTPTLATIEPSFSRDRLGARTLVGFGAHFSGGEEGVPSALRKVTVLVPAGLAGPRLEWPTTLGCSRTHLQRHGARGCPPRSQLGSGQALIEWREGARTVTESSKLWAFLAPPEGEYAIELLGEGYTPIHRRVVITESLFAMTGTYSGGLEGVVPPIPTRPGEPDASVVSFSLTMGTLQARHGSRLSSSEGMGLFVPGSCPAGGFPWEAEFTYADGSVQQATASVPCP
jgi:hypothetical protein